MTSFFYQLFSPNTYYKATNSSRVRPKNKHVKVNPNFYQHYMQCDDGGQLLLLRMAITCYLYFSILKPYIFENFWIPKLTVRIKKMLTVIKFYFPLTDKYIISNNVYNIFGIFQEQKINWQLIQLAKYSIWKPTKIQVARYLQHEQNLMTFSMK